MKLSGYVYIVVLKYLSKFEADPVIQPDIRPDIRFGINFRNIQPICMKFSGYMDDIVLKYW